MLMNESYKSNPCQRNVFEEAKSVIAGDRASVAKERPSDNSDVQ
jgi:hypothetical protein